MDLVARELVKEELMSGMGAGADPLPVRCGPRQQLLKSGLGRLWVPLFGALRATLEQVFLACLPIEVEPDQVVGSS
jgi:hypothetical protein